MTTGGDIRKELNDKDIDRLTRRFLCALKDMDGKENRYFNFRQVYEETARSQSLWLFKISCCHRNLYKLIMIRSGLQKKVNVHATNLDILINQNGRKL